MHWMMVGRPLGFENDRNSIIKHPLGASRTPDQLAITTGPYLSREESECRMLYICPSFLATKVDIFVPDGQQLRPQLKLSLWACP